MTGQKSGACAKHARMSEECAQMSAPEMKALRQRSAKRAQDAQRRAMRRLAQQQSGASHGARFPDAPVRVG